MTVAAEPEANPGIVANATSRRSRQRRRLLIVEDNRGDVFLVQEAIRAYNVPVEICIVEDGAEAMALVERADRDAEAFCPELVLLDLNLPKRNGLEVLRYIRQSRRCKSTPVIVLTSSDSSKDREESGKLGANRYFRKPNTFDQFLKVGAVLNEMIDAEG
jgi:CheY-like chemotaxis protein